MRNSMIPNPERDSIMLPQEEPTGGFLASLQRCEWALRKTQESKTNIWKHHKKLMAEKNQEIEKLKEYLVAFYNGQQDHNLITEVGDFLFPPSPSTKLNKE